jgi:hypothetical protein
LHLVEPDGVRVAVLLWRLLRIDGYIQQIIVGVVIIAAIFLDRLRRHSVSRCGEGNGGGCGAMPARDS